LEQKVYPEPEVAEDDVPAGKKRKAPADKA
jgi:hypothetical protein